MWVQAFWFAAGLTLLVLGAESLVRGASRLALFVGVSPLVIGLTVVAFGTSTPEMAVSVHASLAGNPDIAIGNFNILAVVGAAGLVSVAGIPIPDAARHFDLWVMLAVALACLPIMLTGGTIARWKGAVFLGYYAAYTAYLVLAVQQHSGLPAFSAVMLGYVVPMTLWALVVSLLNHGTRTRFERDNP
jgi:cation:H+ antiporter